MYRCGGASAPPLLYFNMKVLIVLNAYQRSGAQVSKAERLKCELEALGADVEITKNFRLADVEGANSVSQYACKCVFLDKDKAAAYLLEKAGCRLYNSARAMELCDDKMLTHAALCDEGIPMPHTIYAPLCYYPDAPLPEEFLKGVGSSLGYPLVAKLCYGSLGAGVFLITDYAALCEFEGKNKLLAHLYQQYITPAGTDVRCIVVGGKFLCAMKRVNSSDFRSNVELGGHGEKYEADAKLIDMCERAARALGLDYCGIDVLFGGDGERYVCEVNSNAFFAEAERVCGVNIAKKFAELIISE